MQPTQPSPSPPYPPCRVAASSAAAATTRSRARSESVQVPFVIQTAPGWQAERTVQSSAGAPQAGPTQACCLPPRVRPLLARCLARAQEAFQARPATGPRPGSPMRCQRHQSRTARGPATRPPGCRRRGRRSPAPRGRWRWALALGRPPRGLRSTAAASPSRSSAAHISLAGNAPNGKRPTRHQVACHRPRQLNKSLIKQIQIRLAACSRQTRTSAARRPRRQTEPLRPRRR